MKKSIFLSVIVSLTIGTIVNAQVSSMGNNSPPGTAPRFLGWDGTGVGGARDLDIRNNYNRPINFFTNGLQRTRLNGTLTNTITGYATPKDGYLWLGHTLGFASTTFNNTGAFSLLHLNGRNGAFIQRIGHRNWMQTGITLTYKQDLNYTGLRQVAARNDDTKTVIG